MSRYATTKIGGKSVSTHRLVWERANGPIPDGYVVHHRNHDRRDNRLENLELMTHGEHAAHHNNKHPRIKVCESCGKEYEPEPTKRERSKTCSRECFRELAARAVGTQKGTAKMTDEKVIAIRRRVAAGTSQKVLCAEYGLSAPAMSMLVNRKTWKHVA